jgi:hypothetical protein
MFVTFMYRVRAIDAPSALFGAQVHLNRAGSENNFFKALYVVCYETGHRQVLVGPEDWRKREGRARAYNRSMGKEIQALSMAKELRFYWLFDMVSGSPERQAIFRTLQEEYFEYVTGPRKERMFFAATARLMRELLDDGTWDTGGGADRRGGRLSEYLRRRDREIEVLLDHTTEESYPFTTPGPTIYQSKCFDLGGVGPPHYIVMDVHM